eukprot:2809636-Karenia_brevis.AAC.1
MQSGLLTLYWRIVSPNSMECFTSKHAQAVLKFLMSQGRETQPLSGTVAWCWIWIPRRLAPL